ncbi:hypothetical protein EAF04_008757 [Stromatinia cepivora]|nr:hypothetical protein EAF04_008757 [Stromatinia cepivora]
MFVGIHFHQDDFNSVETSTVCESEVEPSNYALYNRGAILLLELLLHLGPVTIAAGLAYLNVQYVYWSDVKKGNEKWQNNILGALQICSQIQRNMDY